jgi:glycosyltransferase involved in cell wall biosynthesis
MKIAIISYIYPNKVNPSLGLFVHQQAKYIAKEGHDVNVIVMRTKDDKPKENIDGVMAYKVANINSQKLISGFLFLFNSIKKLYQLNKNGELDLVIGNFLGIHTIITGIFLRAINKKFIVISHGTSWELPKKSKFKNLIIKLALSFPDKIVCVSRETKELLSQNTDKKNLVIINNGMDPDFLTPSKSKQQFKKELGISNELVILSVSHLVKKKGVDVIIRSLPNVIKEYPLLKYFIVGEGIEKARLKELVSSLNLQKNIKFVGRKIGSELANYYNLCDFFILMSRDLKDIIESFGIVYIEASYFGKPVIAGKSGGTADAVVDGKTGYIIKYDNIKKLEKTILLLLKNKKLRDKLGEAGRKRVLKEFLWKNNVEKLLDLYNKKIKRKHF